MPRLLLLLIMLVFTATNGLAAPLALCQHADVRAHMAARVSADQPTAAAAHDEEVAAAAAEKQGFLADAAAAALIGGLLPKGPALELPVPLQRQSPSGLDSDLLTSRAIPPLLNPPLA